MLLTCKKKVPIRRKSCVQECKARQDNVWTQNIFKIKLSSYFNLIKFFQNSVFKNIQ